MPYLIFSSLRGRELGRRSLDRSVVIGRSPECDICVHDILLSRRHCQIEREGSSWSVSDLMSRNGTYISKVEVGRHALRNGEEIRIGRTVIKFMAGKIQPAKTGGKAFNKPNKPSRQRPADPWTANEATVSGLDFARSVAERKQQLGAVVRKAEGRVICRRPLPTPQPAPREPIAFNQEELYTLLTELASSSWDSIYSNASRPTPTRPPPRPMLLSARHPRRRRDAGVDLTHHGGPRVDLLSGETTITTPPEETGDFLFSPLEAIAEASLATRQDRPRKIEVRAPAKKTRWALRAARALARLGQAVLVLGIIQILAQ